MNCDGSLSIRVLRGGEATAMADIVRAVEAAQARAAPIQRLADAVAGRFALGVMAASAATFAFWSTAGPSLFPQVGPCPRAHMSCPVICALLLVGRCTQLLNEAQLLLLVGGCFDCFLHYGWQALPCADCGVPCRAMHTLCQRMYVWCQAVAKFSSAAVASKSASLLLSLQLACNVLVVACPCALGLAAPTAVLVGTSSAARRCFHRLFCICIVPASYIAGYWIVNSIIHHLSIPPKNASELNTSWHSHGHVCSMWLPALALSCDHVYDHIS